MKKKLTLEALHVETFATTVVGLPAPTDSDDCPGTDPDSIESCRKNCCTGEASGCFT